MTHKHVEEGMMTEERAATLQERLENHISGLSNSIYELRTRHKELLAYVSSLEDASQSELRSGVLYEGIAKRVRAAMQTKPKWLQHAAVSQSKGAADE